MRNIRTMTQATIERLFRVVFLIAVWAAALGVALALVMLLPKLDLL